MKAQYLFISLFILLFIGTGCEKDSFCTKGEGPQVSETIELPPFTGINLTTASDVTLHQGEQQEVIVTGQQNLIDKLKREVKNDTWEIDFEGCTTGKSGIHIDITIPDLESIRIAGSGDIKGEGVFTELDDLNVKISGSGNIDLDAECEDLSCTISGSGDVRFAGSTIRETLKISGSGDLRAFDMIAEDVDIKISGSGSCEVTATQSLNVNISGSGDVYYKGNPDIDVSISGSGNLSNEN